MVNEKTKNELVSKVYGDYNALAINMGVGCDTEATNGFSLCGNCFWHRKNCVLHLDETSNKCNAHTVRENIPLMFDTKTAFMLLVL
jgi:hypothetical protein